MFTALAREAAVLHQRATSVGWLHVSGHRAAAELIRAEQRRQKREQWASPLLEQSSPITAEGDWARPKPAPNEVVQALGEWIATRSCAVVINSAPLGEIGATLRLSEDATRKRVERALEKMRIGLVKRGITSTTVALAVMLQNSGVASAPSHSWERSRKAH